MAILKTVEYGTNKKVFINTDCIQSMYEVDEKSTYIDLYSGDSYRVAEYIEDLVQENKEDETND